MRSRATQRSRASSSRRRADMAGRLDGKVCVITGAGGGMGREAAIVFTGEGARVCVADLDVALAEETVSLCSGRRIRVRRERRRRGRRPLDSWKRQPSGSAGSTSSTTTRESRPRTTPPFSTRASTHGNASRTSTRRACFSAASTGSRTCSSVAGARSSTSPPSSRSSAPRPRRSPTPPRRAPSSRCPRSSACSSHARACV